MQAFCGRGFVNFLWLRIRNLETLATMNILIIETANEHNKIFAIDFGSSLVARDRRRLKSSLLESAVPDRQSVTIPVEHFQLVAPSIDKQEQVPRKRITERSPFDRHSNFDRRRCSDGCPGEGSRRLTCDELMQHRTATRPRRDESRESKRR